MEFAGLLKKFQRFPVFDSFAGCQWRPALARRGAEPFQPVTLVPFGGRTIGPKTGPCGRAVYFGKPVIVCDIAADPLGDDYRALALAHGLQACWSTPIFSSEGKVLGSFAVLSREPRSPNLQHEKIIAQVTHLAAVCD